MNVNLDKHSLPYGANQHSGRDPKFSDRLKLRPDFLSVGADLLVVWDAGAALGLGFASAIIYGLLKTGHLNAESAIDPGHMVLVGALLAPILLHDGMLGARVRTLSQRAVLQRLSWRLALFVCVLLAIGYVTGSLHDVRQAWLLTWLMLVVGFSAAGRLLFFHHVRTLERAGILLERLAVVGVGDQAMRLAAQLQSANRNVRFVGVFSPFPFEGDSDDGLFGPLENVMLLARRREVDTIAVAVTPGLEHRLADIICQLKAFDVTVAVHAEVTDLMVPGLVLAGKAAMPALAVFDRPLRPWGAVLKAIEDRVLAVLFLVLLAPVMLMIAAMVRLDTPGPVLFRQRRVGWNNCHFEVLKFRTMTWNPAQSDGAQQTRRVDQRVTRVGKWLRKLSLDELPQLLNVVWGEMSIVGPRPHPVTMRTEDRLCEEIMAEYSHRHRVKPGITGWAQINGARGATDTVEQVRNRVGYDLFYIDNWSILFDLKIIALTPIKIFFSAENAF